MELALILVRQVAVMFLLIATGILIKRKDMMGEEDARSLSNILLLVVIPLLLVRSFQQELDRTLLPALGLMALLAFFMHSIAIFVAGRCIRDPGDGSTARRVSKLAVVLSNAGFMGFPLLQATVGGIGVMYGAVFLGVFNIVSWAWSVPTLTAGEQRLSFGQLLRNPSVLGFLTGVALYLLQIHFPDIPYIFIDYIAEVNTPLSMIVVGVFLASVKPREALCDRHVYWVVFLRNVFLPMVTLLLLWASRIAVWLPGGKVFALSFLIMESCPSAAACILMPARYNCDGSHGAKLVTVSTALSIVTMPLIVMLADKVL